MDEEIIKKIEIQEQKLDQIYRSVEMMRKYFLWTFILTIVLFILPLIGLLFVIPKVLSIYTRALNF